MVHQTLLDKAKLPFSVLSTTTLFTIFNNAKVLAVSNESFTSRLNTTVTFVESFKNTMDNWAETIEKIGNGISWIIELPHNIPRYSIELFANIYELITKLILQTPTYLFNNPYFKESTLTFSAISIFIVTLLTMIESIKKMIGSKHTEFKDILKRYALVVPLIGSAPFIFEKGFDILNHLTQAILQIGVLSITSNSLTDYLVVNNFNTFILICFDLIILGLAIPILLQNGRRWFDILTLTLITPLSLSAWIFDNYRHLHSKWWSNLKKLSLTQLVYAVYISILTLFIFGTSQIVENEGVLIKLLIITGGLWRLANPPTFVLSMVDSNKDVLDMFDDVKKTYSRTKDTLTLKKIRALKMFKKKK